MIGARPVSLAVPTRVGTARAVGRVPLLRGEFEFPARTRLARALPDHPSLPLRERGRAGLFAGPASARHAGGACRGLRSQRATCERRLEGAMGIGAAGRLKDRLEGPTVLLIETEADPGNTILLADLVERGLNVGAS